MRAAAAAAIVGAVLAGGCIPRRQFSREEVSRYWYLHDDPWAKAQPGEGSMGGRTLPGRWVLRREDSVTWATVSIVRAVDRLKEGRAGEEVVIGVSPVHTNMLADTVADVRDVIERLKEVAESPASASVETWSSAVAGALAVTEEMSRLAGSQDEAGREGDPVAWTAGPFMTMLASLLDEQSRGQLLAGLAETDQRQLRNVLVRVILRVAFAAAGRGVPEGLNRRLVGAMRQARGEKALSADLKPMLAEALKAAPPAASGNELAGIFEAAFKIAPPALEVLAALLRQWDRMDRLEVELRRLGAESVVSVTLRTRPRRQVRIEKLFFMQPPLVLRGSCRITVLPKQAATGERCVLVEPIDGGAAEVRFAGLGWSMVRLFAVPISTAALREIRVWSGGNPGVQALTVTLLMQAGSGPDAARLIGFHDVRAVRTVRSAFDVRQETTRKRLSFTYLKPPYLYSYRRGKDAGE